MYPCIHAINGAALPGVRWREPSADGRQRQLCRPRGDACSEPPPVVWAAKPAHAACRHCPAHTGSGLCAPHISRPPPPPPVSQYCYLPIPLIIQAPRKVDPHVSFCRGGHMGAHALSEWRRHAAGRVLQGHCSGALGGTLQDAQDVAPMRPRLCAGRALEPPAQQHWPAQL